MQCVYKCYGKPNSHYCWTDPTLLAVNTMNMSSSHFCTTPPCGALLTKVTGTAIESISVDVAFMVELIPSPVALL